MSDPDFYIGDYGLDELLTIFEIDSHVTKEEIMEIGEELIDKYNKLGKHKYVTFFEEAKEKLLSGYDTVVSLLDDKTDRANDTTIPKGNDSRDTQLQKNLSVPNTYRTPFAQGSLNPTLQNAYTTWLNIDSQYREILPRSPPPPPQPQLQPCAAPPPPVPAPTLEQTYQINQRESSTDFTFSLANPITNVLAMTVGTIELPLAGYYAFSDTYGNTTFEIQPPDAIQPPGAIHKTCYRIPEGNYSALQLQVAFQDALKPDHPLIKLYINPNNQKAYIYSTGDCPTPSLTFIWGNENCGTCDNCNCCDINKAVSEAKISSEPKPKDYTPIKYKCLNKNKGKKLNSTFGWALGFREYRSEMKEIYTNVNPIRPPLPPLPPLPNPVCMIYGSSVCNLLGSKYFILEVDDFNRNRNNGEMATMSMPSTTNSFTLPTYAKNVSQVYPICYDTKAEGQVFMSKDDKGEKIDRLSRKGTPVKPGPDYKGLNTLTKAQQYTAQQIRNTQTTSDVNQYFSPQASNILFRFPIERDTINRQVPNIISNGQGMGNARKYFGPVTIEKLKIRLLDDKGYPADLHNGDFSFSLILERLYQY